MTQPEVAEDLGESLAAPARSWAADCEFPPPKLQPAELGWDSPPGAAAALRMPWAPPLRNGEDFPRSWRAGELTWRERELARGQLAFLSPAVGRRKWRLGVSPLQRYGEYFFF